jgi:glycosyltransferase involved in cell wall biosynthesis
MPRISLIIPAFNEELLLPRLLDSVDTARQRYDAGLQGVEVIVADNASTDRTAEVAHSWGCRVVRVEKRSIAAARNGGARVAEGEVLAFVDADSLLHPETFNAIERTISSGLVVVGATGVRMNRISLGIALVLLLTVPLLKVAGLDSGVVFCRRADWETVGGYQEERLVAEDVQFLLDMKRLGRARGQGFERAKGVKVVTSARKFDKHGDWHFFIELPRVLLWWLFSQAALERWVRRYWYEDRD